MATNATVTSKGQVVIPAELRKKYGIKAGTQLAFIEEGNMIILQPITEEVIRSTRGISKGGPSLVKMLREMRKAEDW
jgi:AbrB family looped-hinge helix DNA binding protein